MIDARELIAVARESLSGEAPVTESHFRRAISTAYYALFHLVLTTAADRFVGRESRKQSAYAVFYRAYRHSDMRQACVELARSTLAPALRRQLGRERMSDSTREFASSFAIIQEQRQVADYNPAPSFIRSDVLTLIESTERAMEFFLAIDPAEQADVLSLMLLKPRS